MFERILLPLDGSVLAEKALPYGEEFGRRLSSEVILFHVCSPENRQYERMHKIYLDTVAESLVRNMREGQQKDAKVNVTAKIEEGRHSQNICRFVEKHDIGLIIMTSSGASGLKVGKMLGSVTDHVCRMMPIPVMLITPQGVQRIEGKKRLINRILIPLAGSGLSNLALPVGEELAAKLKVPITLFQMAHVIYPYGGEPAPFVDYEKMTKDDEKKVRAEMTEMEKELRGKGLTVTHSVTSGTDAAHEIIEVGKRVDADLVVMSTHGRSGLDRWVFGSVAGKVLRYGEIPLLLVHARAG